MKKKIRPYAPLTILNKRDPRMIGYNNPRFIFLNNFGEDILDGIPEDEFVEFVLSDDFYYPRYSGPCKKINDAVFVLTKPLFEKVFKMSEDEIQGNPFTVRCEWRDFLLFDVFMERWAKCKVSYRPDKEFLDALADTKDLRMTRDMVEHLPSKCFYIDLTELPDIGSLHGMLINIVCTSEKLDIVMYLISDECAIFSFYGGGYYGDDGSLTIDFANMPNKDYRVCDTNTSLDDAYKDRKFMATIGYQMVAYLASKEPDITEPASKKIRKHKTGESVRHNYSEIDTYDVGVRFGTSFREEKKRREVTGYVSSLLHERRSPIPHFRSAHWQRYHVGHGRKETITKWIEPTFVGGDAKDVVIRKVSGK